MSAPNGHFLQSPMSLNESSEQNFEHIMDQIIEINSEEQRDKKLFQKKKYNNNLNQNIRKKKDVKRNPKSTNPINYVKEDGSISHSPDNSNNTSLSSITASIMKIRGKKPQVQPFESESAIILDDSEDLQNIKSLENENVIVLGMIPEDKKNSHRNVKRIRTEPTKLLRRRNEKPDLVSKSLIFSRITYQYQGTIHKIRTQAFFHLTFPTHTHFFSQSPPLYPYPISRFFRNPLCLVPVSTQFSNFS
jgi:hypothetical protein